MLNFSKIICISICWTVASASPALGDLIGDLVDGVGDLLVPGGLENVGENLSLCGVDVPEVAAKYGYETDTQTVTTEDGYILTVHCVYKTAALNPTLNPVIAWHGLMATANTFVLNYPDQSLAFLLADQGYKVFLPNTRGNGYSQGHVNPNRNANNPADPYWNFSWDQVAEFDSPAVIDGVLEWTGKSKVIYIGHSQGTTTMFAFLSTNESYNEKISIFVALAPVTYFSHTTSPLYTIASILEFLLGGLYGLQFLPNSQLQFLLQFVVCTLPTAALCNSLLFLAFGYGTHMDDSRLPVYMCNSPAKFSWGQFLHYVQLVKVNKFQKYDFKSRNQMMYSQPTPPEYDLTTITTPVALFHSSADSITPDTDIATLKSKLSNEVPGQHLNASVAFNHIDYVWGKDVAEIVYADVIKLIKDY